MERRTILIQIDSDPHPSVFDRVVAVDAGVDEVFSYGNVKPEDVQALVHGAIFTRSPKTLKRTALFVGGSDVALGEKLLKEVDKNMLPQFGLRVSVLFDANGANTTSAAAVLAAAQHTDLRSATALVLGGTGPVGQRVARLLARQGTHIRLASRKLERAEAVCKSLREKVGDAKLEPAGVASEEDLRGALTGRTLVIAAGAAGVQLLPRDLRLESKDLRVIIDLNAVPPLGVEGVELADKGIVRDGGFCYGAIGVGATKMKIHRTAVSRLFDASDQLFDAEEVYELALSL